MVVVKLRTSVVVVVTGTGTSTVERLVVVNVVPGRDVMYVVVLTEVDVLVVVMTRVVVKELTTVVGCVMTAVVVT